MAVIDADTFSVDDRLRQLEQSLTEDGQAKPGATSGSALAPKRNVETWIFHLLGNAANEEDNYKNRVSTSDIKPSVAVFLKMCPLKIATISLRPFGTQYWS